MPQRSTNLNEASGTTFGGALRNSLRHLWSAGPTLCVVMVLSSILAALLAPLAIVILGLITNEIKTFLSSGQGTNGSVMHWVLLAGAAGLAASILAATRSYCRNRLEDEVSLAVRQTVLSHMAALDLASLEDKKVQDVLERASNDPGKNLLKLFESFLKFISSSIQVFGLAAVMLWISPVWAGVLLLLAIPLLLVPWRLSGMRHVRNRNQTSARRWARYFTRGLSNNRVAPAIKILDLAPHLIERHDTIMRKIMQENRTIYRWELTATAVSALVSVLGLMGALMFISGQATQGVIGLGSFVAFWMAAWRMQMSTRNAVSALAQVRAAYLHNQNLQDLLSLRPLLDEYVGRIPAPKRGELSVSHLTFSYSRDSRPVLRDLNFDIRAGETVAIVGHNGAGKTTLAKLLSRLYQPSEGQIHLDGVSLLDIEHGSLRKQIALVQQHPMRFEATAAEYIAYGDWRRLLGNREEVIRIAQAAQVDEMIQQLPDGYDTLLGRMFGDHDLSGGQWQKLTIAQALACDPSIVILDEPTSSLDVHAEQALFATIRELVHDRTTILISHRFSTVHLADRILVLHEGELAEQGTHQELIAMRGIYHAMYERHRTSALKASNSTNIKHDGLEEDKGCLQESPRVRAAG